METREPIPVEGVYHERQMKELCALHALNNLFQSGTAFTKKDLDEICVKLSPNAFINPHRNILGLGNYDVNVIMAALQKKGYETIWFDKRKDVGVLVVENIMGFILNTPTDYRLGFVRLPFHRKHWIAIRKVGDFFLNLDSKLDSPEMIGGPDDLVTFLRHELREGDKELLLVVDARVSEAALWRRDSLTLAQHTNHLMNGSDELNNV
ncbi:hypothetical protein C0Q70_00055 [Pomacea canaliculata]|uniref:Josephin-2 n=2 Tax=Pomacea canaliculata TaxID=400727 RepID=A0A2T7PVK7_POMCA|nr:josephin-1-like isoform X3 [Pomacea canaliculata]PVD37465.1 hypothetical protein C0Q70_00055 [Pomacea canaliculata]